MVRALLWKVLGTYLTGEHAPPVRWIDRARDEFQHHADAGVHSACEWVLRKAGHQVWIEETAANLASRDYPQARRWRTTDTGYTLLRITAPGPFVMSHARPVTIDYDYEVASLETNWHQVIRQNPFLEDFMNQNTEVPDGDRRRAASISWWDAAHYCNWLSEQEGIPRDQWCYEPAVERVPLQLCGAFPLVLPIPPSQNVWQGSSSFATETGPRGRQPLRVSRLRPKLRLVPDYRQRTGFRMPLESEWEWLEPTICESQMNTPQYRALLSSRGWNYDNCHGDYSPRQGGLMLPGSIREHLICSETFWNSVRIPLARF